MLEFKPKINNNFYNFQSRIQMNKSELLILDILEDMANTPSLINEIDKIVKKNKFLKDALNENSIKMIKDLFESNQHFANELDVVHH